MPKPATGELCRIACGWEARITIEGTRRKAFILETIAKTDEAGARERCAALAQIAVRLRRAGRSGSAPTVLARAARAGAGRPWNAVLQAVDLLCTAGATEDIARSTMPTFVAFAKQWTDGDLHKKWPDHVPKKDSEADARMIRLYVEPVIHDVGIDAFTLDDAEQIMASLPSRLGSASRRQIAQCVRRVLALSVYPARLRRESPIPRGWMPKVKLTKAFTYLYPSEDKALLGAVDVPLVRRLFFGVLAREGLRREELASLCWKDLDLEKGHIALDRNKTDDPRSWALDPAVARTLEAWRDRFRTDAEPSDGVFDEKGCSLYVGQMAAELRADLETAGLKREALFERSDVRRPLRVHDLRATFVTVSLANGKTETWVADRTGHRSSEMINRYRRAARTWAELDLGKLEPLDTCIPELTPSRSADPPPSNPAGIPDQSPTPGRAVVSGTRKTEIESAERARFELAGDLRPHMISSRSEGVPGSEDRCNTEGCGVPERDGTRPDATSAGESSGNQDPVEATLAKALGVAAAAGRFDVVAQLARELEARRLAHEPNVVALATSRRSKA